ncbi:hypothetical protein WICPIJ_007636 [Wickerhamomyces pijperi]|uniref:Amino acid transporter transmembrane domain-containing protein n=1 Tax=Wickerhamomyces pijperi TaxID=599730 RepID=A0A9P8Q1E1_WICPI|nr:hypothetical protein WICPIJ_007636 [Wickerhamomyces pijperi]
MSSTNPKYQQVPTNPIPNSTPAKDSFELDSLNEGDGDDEDTLAMQSSNNNTDNPFDDDFTSMDIELDEDQGQEQVPFDLNQLLITDKSSLKMAFMNMANSILGAGAIGTPFAISNTGLIGGIIAILLLTILVDFTIRLIIINLKLSGRSSYQDTVYHCFGLTGKIVIILTQALFAFGGSIGFCIIIGDTFPHILRSFFPGYINHSFLVWLFSRNVIIVLVTLFISFPLSLSRDISNLAKASALALVSMTVIILIILIHGPSLSSDLKGTITTSQWIVTPRIFQGISVISFAFVCHHNTSFIFHSLKNPTLNRFAKITHASCFVSMIALSLIGFGGFGIFQSKIKGNILNNFPSDDWMVNIARFCFGFNMLTTFPLEIFVLRDVLKDLYYVKSITPVEISGKAHFILTTVLVLITMSISLTTCNLGALFELIGATTASIMAYILPPMCNLAMTGTSKTKWQKVPYYGCILFGFSVMIISSSQTISKAWSGSGEQDHCVI